MSPQKGCMSKSMLSSAQDWECQAYLDGALQSNVEVDLTRLRPRVVITEQSTDTVIMGELTGGVLVVLLASQVCCPDIYIYVCDMGPSPAS